MVLSEPRVPDEISPGASLNIHSASVGVKCPAPRRLTAIRGPRRLLHRVHSFVLSAAAGSKKQYRFGGSSCIFVDYGRVQQNGGAQARITLQAGKGHLRPQRVAHHPDSGHIQLAGEPLTSNSHLLQLIENNSGRQGELSAPVSEIAVAPEGVSIEVATEH